MTTFGDRGVGVARPGQSGFDAATQVFNLSAPARPDAAATVHTVDQIRAALHYADAERMSVRVHSTGHGAATAGPMRGAVLLRTEFGDAVEVDPHRRVARIPAGCRWSAVIDAAAAHGLAAPHGSSPLVGAVGYLLRGGVSCYGRRVGVAANSVRAIELVIADGEQLRVDATSDPELFWALRGGGGGFGVVTAVEIDLFAAAQVITGAAYWPATHAARLVPRWLRWTADAPREVTTSLRLMNLPALPEIPPALTAGPVLGVDGVVLAETDDKVTDARRYADDLLGPLRSVAEPALDTWRLDGPSAVPGTHLDPTEPYPLFGDHLLLGALGDDGAAEFLRVVGAESSSPLINAELRQLGGALSTPTPTGGALDHFDARYAYLGGGVPFGPVTAESIRDHCAVVRSALSPWDTGRTAPTFVENRDQPQGHLNAEQVRAVDRVRARVDPSGRFRGDISPNTTASSDHRTARTHRTG